jgi:hypothetical protein
MSLAKAIVILLIADAVAIGAMLLVRRRAPEGSYFADGDRASGVFGVLSTGFAIFAGFVVFLSFTNYDDSRAGAESEALSIRHQFETAQLLPVADRGRLSGQLICYGRSVVYDEWPQMERGVAPSLNPWTIPLFETLRATHPKGVAEETAYGNWLDQTSTREEARQARTHGAEGITPTSVWLVLFTAAAVIFAFMLFFADSAELAKSQAMLIGSATTIVVLTLLVIKALDNPHARGLGSLKPVAMERTLKLIDEASATLHLQIRPPCDERGTPTGP